MNNAKYKLTVGILSLIFSLFAFIGSLICMVYYIKTGYSELSSVILLPILLINVAVVSIISVTSFLSIGSKLGKIAFLLNFCSIIFIIVSFIYLYR